MKEADNSSQIKSNVSSSALTTTESEVLEAGHVSDVEKDQPIEAGLVSEANKELPFHKEKHQADTARKLAFGLLIILGTTIIIHYAATLYLELKGQHDAVNSIEKIFNSWLPVISGLVGGAVTYYFTKDK
jgi:hypothetical protein